MIAVKEIQRADGRSKLILWDLAQQALHAGRDVGQAVRETKAGKIEFRVDKGGNVHAAIGKVSFPLEALETNFTAFMDQIVRSKPSASKGIYVRNVAISSTMGPGVTIDTTPYR